MKKIFPYLLIVFLDYYLLPLFIREIGSAMVFLLLLMPLIVFFVSIACGRKNSCNVLYILFVALLFIPSVYLYYNESAWIYVLIFGLLGAVGTLIGAGIKKKRGKENE